MWKSDAEAMEICEPDLPTPPERKTRRRLRQSTLFPHLDTAGKEIEVRREESASEGDEVECNGSQVRKKRMAKAKVTPQPKSARKAVKKSMSSGNGLLDDRGSPVRHNMKSPRKSVEKQQGITTPNKKVGRSNLVDPKFRVTSTSPLPTERKIQLIPDLRLEAKLSAKEICRTFAGKHVHPFFSFQKLKKVIQDTAEAEVRNCHPEGQNSCRVLGPIHVFESTENSIPALDWSRWAFSESIHSFVDSLHFNNHLKVNGIAVGHLTGISSDHPISIDEDLEDYEEGNVGGCSMNADHTDNRWSQKESSILHNRHQGCHSWDTGMLWTKKYEPKRATEVCGNNKSVSFLCEWLHMWHAKDPLRFDSSNGGQKNMNVNSDQHYYESDCDLETKREGAKLKNVLLVTGPVGSGKSASIYACAKEQGFNVIEVNTSDWRSGALIKQKFGEAVESHRVKRLKETQASPSKEYTPLSSNHHINSQGLRNEEVEVIAVPSEDETSNSVYMSPRVPQSKRKFVRDSGQLKTLVLFDAVDVTFSEDRGFLAAIQHLAGSAKLPIILTSNSSHPVLPEGFDREEIYFSRPLPEDLFSHVTEICAAEKAAIQPTHIQKFVKYFDGDIRKTIMHLQFWSQSTAYIARKFKDVIDQTEYDLEAAYQLLMELKPSAFASELSELIVAEINRLTCLQDKYSTVIEFNEEHHNVVQHGLKKHSNKMDCIQTTKDEMLEAHAFHNICDPFEAEFDSPETSELLESPIAFHRQNIHKKLDHVLSLSEDDETNDYGPVVSLQEPTPSGNNFFEFDFSSPPGRLFDKVLTLNYGDNLDSQIPFLDTSSRARDSCGIIDLSCVPESSIVPETRINDELEDSCKSVSYAPARDILGADCLGDQFQQNLITVNVECYEECLSRLHFSQNTTNSYDINVVYLQYEDIADSYAEYSEVNARRWQVMDECSRMDFHSRQPTIGNAVCKKTSLVQETWKLLRGRLAYLRKYVTSNQKDGSRMLRLTFHVSNLMSEIDLLSSDCHMAENLHMTSTFSAHGSCLYVKTAAAAALSSSHSSGADLAQELFAYCSNTTKVAQGVGMNKHCPQGTSDSQPEACTSLKRELNYAPREIIQSVVSQRLYGAMRGEVLHEYRSSLNRIGLSEVSRLSAGVERSEGRRRRLGQHYLNTGALSLSEEDISLLAEYQFR